MDTDGLAGRVVQIPVPESRYSSLRPVKDGLAWLREPLAGTLGKGMAQLDGAQPRACLERFDLGLQPTTYPQDAPRGPVVALADEFSGSDGDIVTAAIRVLGLGPVVGARTWGGVIGIDGFPGHTLVDGTATTVPRYAIWMDTYGWGVENHGVEPDVEVLITPDDWAAGRDPQLEAAVRVALEALGSRPAAAPPPVEQHPSKARPDLPPGAAG